MSEHAYERKAIDLATGAAHRIKLPPRVLRGRLTGFLFDRNKTFLLPEALKGVRGVANFYAAHPGLKVLVTGHTDTVGPDPANRGLSEERAGSVAAFLTDDVDAWLKHYGGTAASARWGTREDQYMLSALPHGEAPYYAGPASGTLDEATQDATRRFQEAHGLKVDGTPGPITRRALVTDYLAADGTSLPAGTELQRHGCGEYHLAVPTPEDTDEPANRRVEVFFFEGPIEPAPRPKCPAPGCPEYLEWLARTRVTIDFSSPPGEVQVSVVDRDGNPLAGAAVHLAGLDPADHPTADDGYVRFPDVIPGRHSATATLADFLDASVELEVPPGSVVPVRLMLKPRRHDIDLIVYDQQQQPLADAKVELEGRAGVVTIADGLARYEKLELGQYKARIQRDEFLVAEILITVEPDGARVETAAPLTTDASTNPDKKLQRDRLEVPLYTEQEPEWTPDGPPPAWGVDW